MTFATQDSANGTTGAGRGFVLGPDEGDPYWWLGSLSINKLTAARTGGGLDIRVRRRDHRAR